MCLSLLFFFPFFLSPCNAFMSSHVPGSFSVNIREEPCVGSARWFIHTLVILRLPMPLISELYICWDVTFVDGRGGDSKRQAATRARNKKSSWRNPTTIYMLYQPILYIFMFERDTSASCNLYSTFFNKWEGFIVVIWHFASVQTGA